MQNTEYRDKWGISQSMIKDFQWMGPKRWYKTYIEKSIPKSGGKHFDFGSLVDTLAFTPDLVSERFVVAECEMPSDAVKSIMECVYNELCSKKDSIAEMAVDLGLKINDPLTQLESGLESVGREIILKCADEHINEKGEKGWNRKYKPDTRHNKLIEQGSDYFNFLVEAAGKTVISTVDNLTAIDEVNTLKSDPNTRPYFIPQEGESLYHQLEIFGKMKVKDLDGPGYQEIDVKGAIDTLRACHNLKEIHWGDFKTDRSAYNFTGLKKYSYPTQVSYYNELIKIWIENEHPEYKEYKIMPPVNIVIDIDDRIPYVYEYTKEELALEKIGNRELLPVVDWYGTEVKYGKVKKGWVYWLEEIAWHLKTNQWDKPRELYKTGKIKLNLINT